MRMIALAALLMPAQAVAFTAQNGMTVIHTGPAGITVLHDVRRGDTDYWCAAGDFAQRALGLPGKTPIWRASPKPRRAGEGIVFTLDPRDAAEGAGISQFGRGPRDGSIPVGMAVGSFCQRIIPYRD